MGLLRKIKHWQTVRLYRRLHGELAEWQRVAGYHEAEIQYAFTDSLTRAVWKRAHRKAQDNVHRIRQQILTIDLPQAKVIPKS